MDSRLLKQILVGGLAGILVFVLTYIFLGSKREELENLKAQKSKLEMEVAKGIQLKANYEKLKTEVAEQERQIEQLVKLMPTNTDKGEVPYRIKKLADTAGIEQMAFKEEAPIKKEFYTEYPFTFTFKAGYHTFGQFTSLISGYDKIINVSEMQMRREGGKKSIFPTGVTSRVSAFVYNPDPPKPAAGPGAPRSAAPAKGSED